MDEQVDRRLTMCDGHPHFLHHAGHRVEGPVPTQLSKANEGGRECVCEDDNDRD